MKNYYTPVKASLLLAVLSAALLFFTSMSAHAANTNNGKPAKKAPPNPQALLAASLRGDLRMVQRLVKERVNIHYTNSDKETALHMAASRGHLAIVIFLIQNKANINARTRTNWIPLHHAVRFNRPRVANYLM
ncbi:MAG: ankyrin repeat domain-containing protein, partial [Leucothrix sp.]